MELHNFRLVLVNPLFAGNLGAMARVCANFGLRDIVLVNPECSANDAEALRYAVSDAGKSILSGMRSMSSLSEALADCQLAVAFARKDNRPPVMHDYVSECWNLVANTEKSAAPIALVFGREDHGLSNDEIGQCSFETAIETADWMPTMNLSHSVAVVLHTLFRGAPEQVRSSSTSTPSRWTEHKTQPLDQPAELSKVQALMNHWRQFTEQNVVTQEGTTEKFMTSLQSVLLRSKLTQREVGMLHTFLSRTQNVIKYSSEERNDETKR